MDEITEEQQKVVDELRNRTIDYVTPKMLEDVSLFYRFAKAREFNLVQAEDMLKKHIAWRKVMQIDTILTEYEPPEVLVKYIPTNALCFGKDESLVRIVDIGGTDLKGLWNVSTTTEFMKYVIYVLEKDKDEVLKQGLKLDKPMYSAIYEFENMLYANAMSMKTIQLIVMLMRMFVDNYPETIRRIVVINAPIYFGWMYNAAKRVLPDSILQKVRIHGKDGWKDNLLEFIYADDLPMYLGGNKTDPDGNPLCKTFIHRGCPIPKKYYVSKRVKKLSLDPDVEKITVAPFSKEEITFDVKEENSFLEWEFETKHRDINFSLFFTDDSLEDLEPVEIIPLQRIDTSFETEKGSLKCEKVGKYTILFDNSFSWIHSKEIYYKAEIRPPTSVDIYEAM
ncbi:retinal-binding protein-like [Argiope bruennichi]|uniref:SEC14-like protein 2 like protein n=1 Tax=Argiope bruennichi TaxID=94029 RepID=A0A8T0FKY2_ARGBR|nr:retinal-binding protein-like [Argiope bruennichi]XP_055939556.1 retinal-binding protein-like [Argiope bruennichi]XP_055939557.1 retinal-binding protein-like [Argiope bruennichi]XP_055939558.1 retinal-binding protein-like [Argiope bruennichi]XP_055939559.1 retinal-binding protein-like [Argiope bruennichi]KAF8791867.1 SEC14-like protein 2 like protein [Argiope bruennichi]